MTGLQRLFATAPRLLLLDQTDEDGEPRCALICAGRQPVIFRNLTLAVDALRQDDQV